MARYEIAQEESMAEVSINICFNIKPFEPNEVYEIDWRKFPSDIPYLVEHKQMRLNRHSYQKYIIPQHAAVSDNKDGRPDVIFFDVFLKNRAAISSIQINDTIAKDMLQSGAIKKSKKKYIKAKFKLLE